MAAADSAKEALTPKRREILAGLVRSPCLHLETCVEWFDDNGKLWSGRAVKRVPSRMYPAGEEPRANTLQRRIEDALAWARKAKIPARIIVLKGRRSGSTTIWMKILDLECKRQRTQALFMADVFKRSDTMMDMARQFAASDVFPWGFGAEAKQNVIEYGNGSRAIKETALDPNAGRASGNRVVVFSEPAHYPTDGVRNADKLMMATLGTVPKTPESIVAAESTANGQSGWFYERWQRARWPEYDDYWKQWDADRGEEDPDELWIRVFAAWFEIPRNVMPVSEAERERILATLTAAERTLIARYKLTPEQIKWRRVTIQSEFNGREAQFDQEFPESPQVAFMASGSPAFARDSMAKLRAEADHAQWKHGMLEHPGATGADVRSGRMKGIAVHFRETPEEESVFSLLEMPRDGCEYVISIDPSSGQMVAEEEGGLGRSKTSVLVWRRGYTQAMADGSTRWHRPRLVARARPEIMDSDPPEDVVIWIVALLANFFGDCPVIIELNMGQWLIVLAKQAGLTLYHEMILDQKENRQTPRLGFHQDDESRNTIIKRFQSLVHGSAVPNKDGTVDGTDFQPDVQIECKHLLGQMETFIRDRRGKWKGAPGRKDDDVLSAAMGLYLIESATRYRRKRVRH